MNPTVQKAADLLALAVELRNSTVLSNGVVLSMDQAIALIIAASKSES